MLKIAIGSDHGGYDQKEEVIKYLKENNYEVIDVGTYNKDSCHYPEYAQKVAELVAQKNVSFGIVICTSGEGVCITANKIKGVRCGLGYNDEVAALMRKHNDANVISFGAKFMTNEEVINRVNIFLHSEFEGGRHQTRVDMIKNIEKIK